MPPKHCDLYADSTPEAVWAWELTQPSLYIEPVPLYKETLSTRETVQSQANLIQSLHRLQQLILKAKQVSDLTGVSTAHARYIKLVQKRTETTAKLQAKALKEQFRLQKEDEKRRQAELERQEKENEKVAKD